MALQMRDPKAAHLADLRRLDRAEDVLAGKEIPDPVETGRVPAMNRDAIIPEFAVALEGSGRVSGHGRQ
jgi:hypothetical protein